MPLKNKFSCSRPAPLQRGRRAGFTLIELLIVIVIIGILAAIAIPKFGKTRERAYLKSMQSDLRNLAARQELHFATPANNYMYAASTAAFSDYITSTGVTISIVAAGQTGWAATAGHAALQANQGCAIFHGTVAAVPAPAVSPGVVACSYN